MTELIVLTVILATVISNLNAENQYSQASAIFKLCFQWGI